MCLTVCSFPPTDTTFRLSSALKTHIKNTSLTRLSKIIIRLVVIHNKNNIYFSRQYCTMTQQSVSALPGTPLRFACRQEVMASPMSGGHMTSRLSNQGNDTFLSPSISSPFQDRKRLTGMDLLLKTKDMSLRGSPRQNLLRPTISNQNILRSPTCSQNILRTPTNQTFKMTANSSPESSEDERWSSSRRSIPLITKSQYQQQTPNKMRGRFF